MPPEDAPTHKVRFTTNPHKLASQGNGLQHLLDWVQSDQKYSLKIIQRICCRHWSD